MSDNLIKYNEEWQFWEVSYNGFTAYFDFESHCEDWLADMKRIERGEKRSTTQD